MLQEVGIRYVVNDHQPGYDWQRALSEAKRLPQLRWTGTFGKADVFLLAPEPPQRPVSYALHLPATAASGATIATSVVVVNDNAAAAATRLPTTPRATVEWLNKHGDVVQRQNLAVEIPSVASAGISRQDLFQLRVPDVSGQYRLSVRCSALGIADERTIDVAPAPPKTAGATPAIQLRSVTWASGSVAAGDTLPIDVTWQVAGRTAAPLTETVQLIGSDNKLHSQWDQYPLDGTLASNAWGPGDVILVPVFLRVPPTIPPGTYRVLVALHDDAKPGQPRQPILLPDGRAETAFLSVETIQVQERAHSG